MRDLEALALIPGAEAMGGCPGRKSCSIASEILSLRGRTERVSLCGEVAKRLTAPVLKDVSLLA